MTHLRTTVVVNTVQVCAKRVSKDSTEMERWRTIQLIFVPDQMTPVGEDIRYVGEGIDVRRIKRQIAYVVPIL